MDGLAGLVKSHWGDPTSGHFFVFCNAGKTRLKFISFDSSAYWMSVKRLEYGFKKSEGIGWWEFNCNLTDYFYKVVHQLIGQSSGR